MQRLSASKFARTWSKTKKNMQKLLNSTKLIARFGYNHLSIADSMAQVSISLHDQRQNCAHPLDSSSGNLCLFLGIWALKTSLPFILLSNTWSLKSSLPPIVSYSLLSRRHYLPKSLFVREHNTLMWKTSNNRSQTPFKPEAKSTCNVRMTD